MAQYPPLERILINRSELSIYRAIHPNLYPGEKRKLPMKLNSNCRLLFVGDSITDCNRAMPVGDISTENGLGCGYVNLVNAALMSVSPEKHIHVMNTGISGNTVRDLQARWRKDVVALAPDWLSIMIGINDVWRQFDGLWTKEQFISPAEFADTLETLVASVQRNGIDGAILPATRPK